MMQKKDEIRLAPIPIVLLTGFLGSGKTTLLNHLVRQPAMADTLVIINEFGTIGLDHLLVSYSPDVVVEMNSGCLCCTIRGDLQKTLRDITWRFARDGVRQFRRVIIETTGLADPAPIVHTLLTDAFIASRYRLDGIVTTVDAVSGNATMDRQPEALKQAAIADRLLITKTDLVDAAALAQLQARLHALNPAAAQILVAHGVLDAQQITDIGLFTPSGKTADVQRWLNEEAYADDHAHHEHEDNANHADADSHSHADAHRHDAHIHAFCFTFDAPVTQQSFDEWLGLLLGLKGADVLRIKGLVHIAGQSGPTVIHGVQHILHPPLVLPEWPSADRRTRIVFITRDIGREVIEKTFAALHPAVSATEAEAG
jgi:G3E family GTPase